MSGAAGAILGLLALNEACGDEAALQSARACGQHLLEALSNDAEGKTCWNTARGHRKMLAGFSSGAAGVAFALLRLHRATGDRALLDAANAAIAYERSLFVPNKQNWLDLRVPRPELGMSSQWCHGATGIGLTRLGCLDLTDDLELANEIEAALATTEGFPISALDSLCCGNLGRVDFLLSAGMLLDRPELLQNARDKTALILSRAKRRGAFALPGADTQLNPGLFSGVSGIGYELLRIADPATFPSILLWG
jgi:lantibiotic modifying enzyme